MNNISDRKRFSVLFRAITSGRISNREFELSLFNSEDRLVHELEELLWCSYDDHKEHKLDPRLMRSSDKKLIARSILFLHSDLEFNWPKYPSKLKKLLSLLTLGFYRYDYSRLVKTHEDYGDKDYWPFRSEEELSFESSRPRLGMSLKYAH